MKKISQFKFGALALLLALSGLTSSLSRAADPGIPVEPVRVINLRPYAGKFLNVFYVAGRKGYFELKGGDLNVRAIMQNPVLRLEIPSNGEVEIPATRIKRDFSTMFDVFNFILFVVTDADPNPVFLRNKDKSPLYDRRASKEQLASKTDSEFRAIDSGYIAVADLAKLPRSSGTLVIDGNTDRNPALRHDIQW